eukprot:373916-Rhodomonas_salina.1
MAHGGRIDSAVSPSPSPYPWQLATTADGESAEPSCPSLGALSGQPIDGKQQAGETEIPAQKGSTLLERLSRRAALQKERPVCVILAIVFLLRAAALSAPRKGSPEAREHQQHSLPHRCLQRRECAPLLFRADALASRVQLLGLLLIVCLILLQPRRSTTSRPPRKLAAPARSTGWSSSKAEDGASTRSPARNASSRAGSSCPAPPFPAR